jgi:hypothetical protein
LLTPAIFKCEYTSCLAAYNTSPTVTRKGAIWSHPAGVRGGFFIAELRCRGSSDSCPPKIRREYRTQSCIPIRNPAPRLSGRLMEPCFYLSRCYRSWLICGRSARRTQSDTSFRCSRYAPSICERLIHPNVEQLFAEHCGEIHRTWEELPQKPSLPDNATSIDSRVLCAIRTLDNTINVRKARASRDSRTYNVGAELETRNVRRKVNVIIVRCGQHMVRTAPEISAKNGAPAKLPTRLKILAALPVLLVYGDNTCWRSGQ